MATKCINGRNTLEIPREVTGTIVYGAGLEGILAALVLRSRGLGFSGLDPGGGPGEPISWVEEALGPSTRKEWFCRELPFFGGEAHPTASIQRVGQEWAEYTASLEGGEEFLLQQSGGWVGPRQGGGEWIVALAAGLGDAFRPHSPIRELSAENHELITENGARISFTGLLWCRPARELFAALKDRCPEGLKRRLLKVETRGALLLEQDTLPKDLPTEPRTLVFPFRFKEHRLKAYGTQIASNGATRTIQWIAPVAPDLGDDKEELAKLVRALKRDLGKAFTSCDLRKISYLPDWLHLHPIKEADTEILPDVHIITPQLLGWDGPSEGFLSRLDVAAGNLEICLKKLDGPGA